MLSSGYGYNIWVDVEINNSQIVLPNNISLLLLLLLVI